MINTSGSVVASYTYDPYGNIVSATGAQAQINPLRYRGYVYDSDTGFYCTSSRYYDPAICRFINADESFYLGINGDFTSYNLFAYCGNNPIMGYDPQGTFNLQGFIQGAMRTVTGVGAIAAGIAVCVVGAPAVTILVAAVTITTGILTVTNGAADIQQSITGDNFVRDTVFNGNETAYNIYASVTEAIAIAGTALCGNYLSSECVMRGYEPGTGSTVTLSPGQQIDRYGSPYGRYMTDPGTPASRLALTPQNSGTLNNYVVNRPFTVQTGIVSSCRWGTGGGIQYFSRMSVHRLVQFGYLSLIS